MSTLNVFWMPEDCAYWLTFLARQYSLRLLVFPPAPDVDHPVWLLPPFDADQLKNAFHLYLVPVNDEHASRIQNFDDVQPRIWGWVVVRGGRIFDRPFPMLEATEVIAELKGAGAGPLGKCVKRLGRQLAHAQGWAKGVTVTLANSPASKNSEPSYFHSADARLALRKGLHWVQAQGATNIRFAPSVT